VRPDSALKYTKIIKTEDFNTTNLDLLPNIADMSTYCMSVHVSMHDSCTCARKHAFRLWLFRLCMYAYVLQLAFLHV